jgi:hypothetical protein
MRFGMKVWFPRTPEGKRGVARLYGVWVDALKESLGIAWSHHMCYSRRNLRGSGRCYCFGLSSMSTKGQSALVRYFYRKLPRLCPGISGAAEVHA